MLRGPYATWSTTVLFFFLFGKWYPCKHDARLTTWNDSCVSRLVKWQIVKWQKCFFWGIFNTNSNYKYNRYASSTNNVQHNAPVLWLHLLFVHLRWYCEFINRFGKLQNISSTVQSQHSTINAQLNTKRMNDWLSQSATKSTTGAPVIPLASTSEAAITVQFRCGGAYSFFNTFGWWCAVGFF